VRRSRNRSVKETAAIRQRSRNSTYLVRPDLHADYRYQTQCGVLDNTRAYH
jgi:hypothetical protein